MIDEQLLSAYIAGFYGFGSYSAKYWFVGMEEGGGRNLEQNIARIESWSAQGRHELHQLGGYDPEPKVRRFFAERPAVQATWGKLIRILLAAESIEPVTLNAVKAYQRDRLGRAGGDDCLLELLPLPSPSANRWLYKGVSSLPHLETREQYKEHYADLRAQHIAKEIGEYKPAVVVFYSFDQWYRRWWKQIAGVEFTTEHAVSNTFLMGGNAYTRFAIVKHPATMGLTNSYFHEVGRVLGQG